MEPEKRKTKIRGRREFLLHVTAAATAGWVGWPAVHSGRAADGTSSPSGTAPWQIGCFTRPWGRFEYAVALDAIARRASNTSA